MLCQTALRDAGGHGTQFSQLYFRASVPVDDLVYQASHQADSSAVRRDVGASLGSLRRPFHIESWSGVADGYRESRRVNRD